MGGGAAKSYPLYESFRSGELVPENPALRGRVLSYLGRYDDSASPNDVAEREAVEPIGDNANAVPDQGLGSGVPPIDVVGNVRVRCFLQGVAEDALAAHLLAMGFEGFEAGLAEGFGGRHGLQAIRETGKYLGGGSDALLVTFDELLRHVLKWCDQAGWAFRAGGTRTAKSGRLDRAVTIGDKDGLREVVAHAYRDLGAKRGYDAMLCALFTRAAGKRVHGYMRFGVARPSAETARLFDEAYGRERVEADRAHKERLRREPFDAARKRVPTPVKVYGADRIAKESGRNAPSQAPGQMPTQEKTARPIRVNEFLVRKSYGSHRQNGHSLQPVRATVSVLPRSGSEPRPVEFDGYWCPKCRKYFMTEGTYVRLKRLGYICCKVVEEKDLGTKKTGEGLYGNLASESILHMYGYTVNQQDDLSETERQTIISFVIENRIQSTQDVAHLLEWLISQREGNPRMAVAVSRWKTDLNFVRHYHRPTRKVRVDRIYAKL